MPSNFRPSVPPSKVPDVTLQFECPDGKHIPVTVPSDIKVSKLIIYVSVEMKLAVNKLYFITEVEDPDDPDIVTVSDKQPLDENQPISSYPLENATILIASLPPPITPPATFRVMLVLYEGTEYGKKLSVDVAYRQTLAEFKDLVLSRYEVSIHQDVLIMVGKEIKGDDMPIWDLGFWPESVIHAGESLASWSGELLSSPIVPYISFAAEIQDVILFDTLLVHPLTTFATVKKLLEPSATEAGIDLGEYKFSRDGREVILDSRRLWDMDIISGAVIYLRRLHSI
jgi:hypothetical protein